MFTACTVELAIYWYATTNNIPNETSHIINGRISQLNQFLLVLSPDMANTKSPVRANMPTNTQEDVASRNNITFRINFRDTAIAIKPIRMSYSAVR
ncbi:hypothetical protein GDQ70_24205 [Escherichia coli]|nr:hypothetical protein [Escherichia coli]EEW5709901.1 hypothetical protein [Escherichia coli]EEW5858993.1 hypothetical protein [Escherichia coli]EEW6594206.1 hypothetical protein [Escherichia coli]EEW8419789.1 hypothetical protein [Escherichia coli]